MAGRMSDAPEIVGAKVLAHLDAMRVKAREALDRRYAELCAAVAAELARDRLANNPDWGRATRIAAAVTRRHGIETSRPAVDRILRRHHGVHARKKTDHVPEA